MEVFALALILCGLHVFVMLLVNSRKKSKVYKSRKPRYTNAAPQIPFKAKAYKRKNRKDRKDKNSNDDFAAWAIEHKRIVSSAKDLKAKREYRAAKDNRIMFPGKNQEPE